MNTTPVQSWSDEQLAYQLAFSHFKTRGLRREILAEVDRRHRAKRDAAQVEQNKAVLAALNQRKEP